MTSGSTVQLLNIADKPRVCSKEMLCIFLGFGCMLSCLSVVGGNHKLESVNEAGSQMRAAAISEENIAAAPTRKLLPSSGISDDEGDNVDYGSPDNQIGGLPPCSRESILILQGQTTPLPNGIPTYTVQVQNVCVSGTCSISDIHLSCGWFSSARLINPRIFRRLGYNDCLVNDGQALSPGQALWFEYANTFSYPMSVSSVSCQ